jgi:flavin-dependent dehydrogenase
LGVNRRFLIGAEAELAGVDLDNPRAFYCFLDAEHAHGYLAWAIPGVGITQVGLASTGRTKPDLRAFLRRIGPVLGLEGGAHVAQRGGLIPVGGLVRPSFAEKVVLIGDAAGTVSPLTAGGIHNAIYYGRRLGALCADYLTRGGVHPGPALTREYPSFAAKLGMRWLYERTPNWALDALFFTPGFEMAARRLFFLKKRLPVRRPKRRTSNGVAAAEKAGATRSGLPLSD